MTVYCSFCGKSQHQVRKIVAGDNAFICDECVIDCVNALISPPKDDMIERLDRWTRKERGDWPYGQGYWA